MSLCGENNHFEILRKKFHITEFDNKNSKNCFAYIINCDELQLISNQQELLSHILSQKKPIIFSNPNLNSYENPFKAIASFNVEVMIYYPTDGYGISYVPIRSATFKSINSESIEFIGSDPLDRVINQLNGNIEPTIQGNPPQNLPEDQYSFEYVNADLSGYVTSNWGRQPVSAVLMYELCLMASFNPALKYLRCISMGNGINPSPMLHDNQNQRGFFTEIANAGITVRDHTSDLTVRENEPPNTNNVTTVTVSSEVSVGVNVSENPGFDASYSITNTETVSVSDFEIINDSKEDNTRWVWQLGLTSDSPGGLLDGDHIHDIPYLSKNNLQMPTVSTFQVSSTESSPFNEDVGLGLKFNVTFRRAWMEGSTMHTDGVEVNYGDLQGSIDFSLVNAF